MLEELSEVDILNRFRELQGLTPIQLRLWRRLWIERGNPVRRTDLFAAVLQTSGDPNVDRKLFDSHLNRLRHNLKGRGWKVVSRPAPRGNARYSLHPSTSDDDPNEGD